MSTQQLSTAEGVWLKLSIESSGRFLGSNEAAGDLSLRASPNGKPREAWVLREDRQRDFIERCGFMDLDRKREENEAASEDYFESRALGERLDPPPRWNGADDAVKKEDATLKSLHALTEKCQQYERLI